MNDNSRRRHDCNDRDYWGHRVAVACCGRYYATRARGETFCRVWMYRHEWLDPKLIGVAGTDGAARRMIAGWNSTPGGAE